MSTLIRAILIFCLVTPAVLAENSIKEINPSGKITYNQHIAPILYQHCVNCHRPDEAAPFSLLDYPSTKRRAETIRRVVGDRYMPPWKPVQGHGEFKQSLRLNDNDVDLIQRWVDGGSLEGDPEQKPTPPIFTKGWNLGKPDLIIEMDEAFEVYAEGRDIYRYFCLPLNLTEDKWVRAIEIRPSSRPVVHHALFFLDSSRKARQLDKAEPKPGFKGKGFQPSGSLGAWAVGGMPLQLGDEFALPLPKESDLVLQTHFHPSGKIEYEKTKIGIYFADGKPERLIGEFQIPPHYGARAGLTIPPGESNYVMEDYLIVPGDMELVTVSAHAHQIGRSMKADATLPDGKKFPLFYIDDWDFNWQGNYQYKTPVQLSKGTRIDVKITYDNSAGNVDNPHSPPRRIHWGVESTDEMGSVIFTCVSVEKKNENMIVAGLKKEAAKSRQRFAKSQQYMIRLHTVLGLDKNRDDRLTLAETPEEHHKLFHQLDKNQDQVVDPDEIKQAGAILDK